MIPPAFDTDRALADVHWLVEELGPRVHNTEAEVEAVAGILKRLRAAGWNARLLEGSPLACRGSGGTLFLAHVDSVPGSPGAVDNAAGVAILLELARSSEASNVCLGFPIGEEYGLIGSHAMANHWSDAPLNLVVSLDLIASGMPTAVDLSADWGFSEMEWLAATNAVDAPFLYRLAGRAFPQWRSDHAPFARSGVLAFQIKTRGEGLVFPRYHQTSDTAADAQGIQSTASALEAMAKSGPPPRGDTDPAFMAFGAVVPGSLVWGTWALGLLSGIPGLPRAGECLRDLVKLSVMTAAAAVVMWALLFIGFPSSEAEITAHKIMEHPATGWWHAAPWAVAAGWVTWMALWRALPTHGHPAFVAAAFSVGAVLIDPLIALPFSLAALGVRLHPLLGLLPALLFIRPDPLREFAFYGLLAPWTWPLLLLLTWPALGAIRSRS